MRLTVEPVIFCYIFTSAMLSPLLQQYIYNELSEQHNFTKAEDSGLLCINGSDNTRNVTALENRIQTQASYWFIALSVSSRLPSIFTTLFYGSMSDGTGRKPLLLCAVVGGLINCFIASMTVTLGWPFYVVFLGSFMDGLMGSMGTINASSLAYIVDVTNTRSRSIRIGILQVTNVFSIMVSYFIGGIWLKNSGYAPPFWACVGILFLCCCYIVLFLPESLKEKQNFSRFSCLANAKRIKEFVLVKRGPYINVCLLLSFISFIFIDLDYFASVTILYTKHQPLCWGPEMIGYYMAAKTAVAGIGVVFTFKVLAKYIPDTLIVIIGCVFFMDSNVILGFAKTTLAMFLSCVPTFFLAVAPPGNRNFASKLVSTHEEGTLCSLIAVSEGLAELLAPITINTLYPVGLNKLNIPGFVFFVEAGLLLVPIILFAIIHYLFRKNGNFLYESLPACSKEKEVRIQCEHDIE